MLFEQVVGDGANIFIDIIAIFIGFVAAMAYQDFVKVKGEEQNQNKEH